MLSHILNRGNHTDKSLINIVLDISYLSNKDGGGVEILRRCGGANDRTTGR